MAQGLEEDADTGPVPEPVALPPVTRRRVRVVAMVVYAVALAAYTELLGIPNDTISVFVWLWFGTIAWNIEAPWRYHLRFVRDWSIPMVGLVIYFYSRGLTDELGLPVHFTMPIRVRRVARSAAPCRPSGSSTGSAATRACGRATRAGTTSSSPPSTPATS